MKAGSAPGRHACCLMQATFYLPTAPAMCTLSRFAIGILICTRMQGAADARRRMQSETSARHSWQSVWHDDNSVITPSTKCSSRLCEKRVLTFCPHPAPSLIFPREFRAAIDYLFELNGKEFYVQMQSRLYLRGRILPRIFRSRLREPENIIEKLQKKKRNATAMI